MKNEEFIELNCQLEDCFYGTFGRLFQWYGFHQLTVDAIIESKGPGERELGEMERVLLRL